MSERCYHCHEPVPPGIAFAVDYDGESRPMCCLGCEAVMSAIIDAGLADYYRFRTEPAVAGELPTDLAEELDALAIYDTPEVSERYLQQLGTESTDDINHLAGTGLGNDATGKQAGHVLNGLDANPLVKLDLIVQDLRCGACVWLLERAVRQLPGVSSVSFNFSTSRGQVEFDHSRLPLSTILKRMAAIGYKAVPFDIDAREQQLQKESRTFSQRLFVAGIGMMQVMMYALPVYVAGDAGFEPGIEQLLRWASLLLTTPVMFYSAWPFLRGAWRDIKNLRPGMDVPVTIGLVLAFSLSVRATLTGHGEIYFDSVSMFVFLLLGTRYLEWRTRRKAMRSIDDVATSAPDTAQLLSDQKGTGFQAAAVHGLDADSGDNATIQLIPAARLKAGDLIRVNAGARVPADARVLQGRGSVDNALLTGESLPVSVQQGDFIAGGALLVGTPLTLRVERAQSRSTLSTIQRLVERASADKPHATQLADYVASIFVSVLLVLASVVFFIWWQVDSSRALSVTISVLIVSCPCALSLATPAAMAAATGSLLQNRTLVSHGHAMDRLAQVTDIVFDKTGTVTVGAPVVTNIVAGASINSSTALALAQWMEQGSAHPYATAMLARDGAASFADVKAIFPALAVNQRERIEHVIGCGVLLRLDDGAELRLGTPTWCGLSGDQQSTSREPGHSDVVLVLRSKLREVTTLATFMLSDVLRPESVKLMEHLSRRGYTLHLLSGDRRAAVQQIADILGITHHQADAKPADKQAYVERLQSNGKTVMMIGDGVNDAPVLAHADVSLAMSSASSLAQTAADVIALRSGLQAVTPLLDKALAARQIMRQNIAWAIGYNVVAIPVAALGLLPAWGAALGMASSSLLVALNALRLWQDRESRVTQFNNRIVSPWNRCTS